MAIHGKVIFMNKNYNYGSILLKIIIGIFFLIVLMKVIAEPSASEKFYQEHKEEIDTYNENHKDDWDGYNGTRRNSWAEDQELKSNGYNLDEYREQHGY